MTHEEKLHESDWQILYCVEARFPGFTRDVWAVYWDHQEESRKFPPSLEERARRLKKEFDPILTITDGDNEIKAANIQDWVEAIDEYYERFRKMGPEDLYLEFKRSLGFHAIAPQKISSDSDAGISPSPEVMLRYAYWSVDEAMSFFSNFVDKPDLKILENLIRNNITDGKLRSEEVPSEIVALARSVDLLEIPSMYDISKIDQEDIVYYTSNRLKNIMAVIAVMSESKFGYSLGRNNNASDDIATLIQEKGGKITSETVRKILKRASIFFNDDLQ